jgi:hypothetical protein
MNQQFVMKKYAKKIQNQITTKITTPFKLA